MLQWQNIVVWLAVSLFSVSDWLSVSSRDLIGRAVSRDHVYVTEEHHHDHGGDTVFGFWIYILSDCILFATLFAVYAVLQNNYVGTPTGSELFDLTYVLGETALLLTSSFTFGMAARLIPQSAAYQTINQKTQTEHVNRHQYV